MAGKVKSIFFFCAWNCIIVLIALELFLRFYLPGPMFHKIAVSEGDNSAYTLSQNRILLYEPKPNTGGFNQAGYRGRLYPQERQKGKKRIVVLGDSVAEGLGVTVEHRFTEILQEYLGDGYEVINLAVRGYNIKQELEYLKVKALQYAPDYVIIGITHNDLGLSSGQLHDLLKKIEKLQGGRKNFYKYYYLSVNKLDIFLLKSNTYRYIKYLQYYLTIKKNRKLLSNDGFSKDVSKNEATTIVKEMKTLAKKNNFNILFVFFPVGAEREGMDIVKTVVEENKLNYLDIDHYVDLNFDAEQKRHLLLHRYDSCHLSKKGQLFCAKYI
ncbi:SGNH/GDSL hydrolase family protein, partial [Candidatus Omnitrophota bacterium]